MVGQSPTSQSRILEAAQEILAADAAATVADIAARAGVSRATIHRYFPTRADLLAAVGQVPDQGTRDRVLAAAAELVGRHGFASVSMDDLAARAGVSRASVYRLFPGKGALLEALVVAYSPFEPMIAYVDCCGDRPPNEVVPELYGLMARILEPNVGLLASVLAEVTSASPEAVEGARRPVTAMLRSVGGYLQRQMDAGRIIPAHRVLAVQALFGPLFFHLLTRSTATRIAGLDVPLDEAADQLSRMALRAMTPHADASGPRE
jgi:AcrR family transcriptional regulator